MSTPSPLTAECLATLPGLRHGFFTRHGGVSTGGYASLNCGLGSKDDTAAVAENRARVAACLLAQDLVTAHQCHSATAIVVERPWASGQRPRVDAIVTATRGLAVGVLTADCAPVLFADAEVGIVAAAHAGWRGAIGGVLEAALQVMEHLGACRSRIKAAVGPCISQPSYQVGLEFEREFLAHDPDNARFFARPSADPAARPYFDLPGYILQRLVHSGLAPEMTNPCSHACDSDFFSYRRSQARKETDYGRQISAIVLT
jgi:YfiH family protein